MDTREVVERYYETVNAGDWETWLTLFDKHVVVDEQLAGHLEGVGAMREEADAIRAGYPKFRMDPQHIVVEGEQACAIWHCTAVSAGGAPVDARGNQLLPRRRWPHRIPGQLPRQGRLRAGLSGAEAVMSEARGKDRRGMPPGGPQAAGDDFVVEWQLVSPPAAARTLPVGGMRSKLHPRDGKRYPVRGFSLDSSASTPRGGHDVSA